MEKDKKETVTTSTPTKEITEEDEKEVQRITEMAE